MNLATVERGLDIAPRLFFALVRTARLFLLGAIIYAVWPDMAFWKAVLAILILWLPMSEWEARGREAPTPTSPHSSPPKDVG